MKKSVAGSFPKRPGSTWSVSLMSLPYPSP
jgi:hypothetical protein